MIDEGFVQDEARLGMDLAPTSALDPKTAALLQLGASVAIGSPAVCLEWTAARAMAAGASEDEIADVLLAIAPVTGLGRVVSAAPEVATALGYDIAVRWRNQMVRCDPPGRRPGFAGRLVGEGEEHPDLAAHGACSRPGAGRCGRAEWEAGRMAGGKIAHPGIGERNGAGTAWPDDGSRRSPSTAAPRRSWRRTWRD